jgi:hypothetical protein
MGQGIDHLKDISQSKQLGNSDSAATSQRGDKKRARWRLEQARNWGDLIWDAMTSVNVGLHGEERTQPVQAANKKKRHINHPEISFHIISRVFLFLLTVARHMPCRHPKT